MTHSRRVVASLLASIGFVSASLTSVGMAAAAPGSASDSAPDSALGSVYDAGEKVHGSAESSLRGAASLGSLEDLPGSSIPNDPNGFYNFLSRDVEGEPGQIIDTQPGVLAFGLPGVDLSAGNTTTIAYVSRDSKGNPTPVTGTIVTNKLPWTGPGERPTLVIAPGTQGTADQCAPSRLMRTGFEYETLPVVAALSKGWNVAMTDLRGLGTPKIQHTYMNRVEQAQATLDMARAAANTGLGGITKTSPVATYGYSQGGGASAAALELAPKYAPEVPLKGGYAGGVPADLAMTANAIDNGALAAAMGYTINGFLESDPEIRTYLEEHLNERGWHLLKQTSDECIWDSLARHAYGDSRTLTKDGRSIAELLKDEPIAEIVRRQQIGSETPNVPVYIGHGTNDDTIPVAQGRTLARTWCEAGTPVYYKEYNIPKVAPLADHAIPLLPQISPAVNWLDQIFRGQDYPTSSCADIPQ
ncbi:hypothetical protein F7230_05740 [Corynebacterium sp. 320]|uniref:lipase family protein n=1 Tax=Corynebacterium TaxID=1716 RepID=UPI00125CB2A1|nr:MULTISPECIES: lipase family protein [Corynebacterium]KAB1503045.1 hypothetical protein F7230_05740 [Corynebacterium sp. 320]KAB1551103.1 hypothetical protein F7232_08625 [Corynebacterium sp. 319]KAB3526842.1 hypothetical protein F8354_05740 [Corynebacterium sp. 250]KAB3538335.1 hypothetical protein F8390_08640 [Corynebacterium sp. 366]QNP92545.1 hypothetical protein IAU67_01575 [Corynebacterium zhongnanshanii]